MLLLKYAGGGVGVNTGVGMSGRDDTDVESSVCMIGCTVAEEAASETEAEAEAIEESESTEE